MVLKMIVKRVVEVYRKLISLLWLFLNIGPILLLKWLFLIILKKNIELEVYFSFKSKKVSLFLESTLTDIILLTEIFFLEVYYIENINNPTLIVDAGANKGLSAVYFNTLWPKCPIHCFEPNKELLHVLKKNLQSNGVNSKVHNKALSDKDGYEYFDISDNHQYSRLSREKTGVKVKTVNLESFYNDQKIDILKMDVEGAEEKIIRSLKKHNINCIIGEVHHNLIDENQFFMLLSKKYHLKRPRLQQFLSNPSVNYPIVTAIRKND